MPRRKKVIEETTEDVAPAAPKQRVRKPKVRAGEALTSETTEQTTKETKKPKKAKSTESAPETIAEQLNRTVTEILDDPYVVYFPIKHFSVACSHHLAKLLREIKPAAVLIEGPQDADSLIPYILHPDTKPPITIFSSYVDKDNLFAMNGILSAGPEIGARYRGWWPMVAYAPEYVALVVGKEVGAELAFCDAPLPATIPYHQLPQKNVTHVVSDQRLAESAYFEALGKKQGKRSFEEFWNTNFEVNGLQLETRDFQRLVLSFAWCARHIGATEESLEADGTLLRERHMRAVLDEFLKKYPKQKIVVVTGAYHSVALPYTKKQKAKYKAGKQLETMLCVHSFHALSSLYSLNKLPQYNQYVWEALQTGSAFPFDEASMKLLLEIMRGARKAGAHVSTADAVEAYRAARNLSILRRNASITLEDLRDAVQMTYIKGDIRIRGGEVEKASQVALVGSRYGQVTAEAGQLPIAKDFYQQCQVHKVEIRSREQLDVHCDIGKQEKHRLKSSFLHQCHFLELPMFATHGRAFEGPDLSTGEDLHLLIERWRVQWSEKMDAALLDLSDRGNSVAEVVIKLLREKASQQRHNSAESSKILLKSAQMMLPEVFGELIEIVEEAISQDTVFTQLAQALSDFVVLYRYRNTLQVEGLSRLLATISQIFQKTVLVLPTLANASGAVAKDALDSLQTVIRIAITFDAVSLDQRLLVEKIWEMVGDPDGPALLRGAGYGILFSLGATREQMVARELESYLLGDEERVLQAGSFLDGLFVSAKNIFLGSPRLVKAINHVLRALQWDTFKLLLPDLRRAFTQFLPSEIDQISQRVSEEIGLREEESRDEPIPQELSMLAASTDARVRALLGEWV